jgi:hypothetical protein
MAELVKAPVAKRVAKRDSENARPLVRSHPAARAPVSGRRANHGLKSEDAVNDGRVRYGKRGQATRPRPEAGGVGCGVTRGLVMRLFRQPSRSRGVAPKCRVFARGVHVAVPLAADTQGVRRHGEYSVARASTRGRLGAVHGSRACLS